MGERISLMQACVIPSFFPLIPISSDNAGCRNCAIIAEFNKKKMFLDELDCLFAIYVHFEFSPFFYLNIAIVLCFSLSLTLRHLKNGKFIEGCIKGNAEEKMCYQVSF
ncbi:MAG: hypothetical protein Q4D56_12735 [Bacteroides sp.]|nr:hypothetical protein [Bacteroides sp.]